VFKFSSFLEKRNKNNLEKYSKEHFTQTKEYKNKVIKSNLEKYGVEWYLQSKDKKLRGKAGFTAMLHSHSRALDYHPHIHVLMPGASINVKTGLWRVKSSDYLFSHKALAKVLQGKAPGSYRCQ